uniref:DUF5641 domain-containing protein n=1 Tax=Trichogramma kaykai TaxID=54128 RepID=A0ABD2XD49_9HYME
MGVTWELMIKSVKLALGATLKGDCPQEEVLLTLLIEIEHSVNSRPLTHMSLDSSGAEALTPNHFLIGTSSGQINFPRLSQAKNCTRSDYELSQMYADTFWKRWLREYMPTLALRKKWHKPQPNLQVDDVVLIWSDNSARNTWEKGVITRVLPGKDGHVRVAEVRKSGGNLLLRPCNKLIKFA